MAELGVQRSELSEERNATTNVRRIHLDLVSLLMINSNTSQQTVTKAMSQTLDGFARSCPKDANAVVCVSSRL